VYGTPHPLEIEFAQKFIKCVPCAERLLLCNSGTEATMQGARIMRAFTGRDKVAKFEGGYHGWHDYAMWNIYVDPDKMGPVEKPNLVPSSAGIPTPVKDTMLMLPFDDAALALIEENAGELAGVMVEPVIGNGAIPVTKAFLEKLRQVTQKHGILLMFDEVKTGFRLALGGAQEFYGIKPDLATYGKIVGGGMPVGAVGCSKDIMDEVTRYDFSISVAGTFSGNPMTLAAGNAMLGYLMDNRQIYDELSRKGARLRDGFNSYASKNGLPACLTGLGSFFQSHLKAAPVDTPRDLLGQPMDAIYDLQLFLRMNGVFVPWFHDAFISTAHSDEIVEEVLNAHIVSVESALALHGLI
jgi:glutamate-1-semialdehyde 2,1-aminomutase